MTQSITKEPIDLILTSALNRRLDSLAYLLAADDACVAVVFWRRQFLISTNDGKHEFIKKCMPFLKSVGKSKNFDHQAAKRRELLNEALEYRIERFKKIAKLQTKLTDAESSKSKLSSEYTNLLQTLDFQNDDSICQCLASIEKLIVDHIQNKDASVIQTIIKMKELFNEKEKEKNQAEEDFERHKHTDQEKKFRAKWKKSLKTCDGIKEDLAVEEKKFRSIVEEIKELETVELFWSNLDDLRIVKKDINDKIKEVWLRLNRCMSKFLMSLTDKYTGDKAHKNFDEVRKEVNYRYIPPIKEGEPIGGQAVTKNLKSHAEMNIIQWIYEISKLGRSKSEPKVQTKSAFKLELKLMSKPKPKPKSELELKSGSESESKTESCHFEFMKSNIYMGNCMLACYYCNQAYEALNNFLKYQQPFRFEYRGTHQWAYPGWKVLDFLMKMGLDKEMKDIKKEGILQSETSVHTEKSRQSKKSEKIVKTVRHILSIEKEPSKNPPKELCPAQSVSSFQSLD